jgi:hypothetical protein
LARKPPVAKLDGQEKESLRPPNAKNNHGTSNKIPYYYRSGNRRNLGAITMDLPNAPPVKNVFKDLGKYGRRGKWRFYSYSGNGQWQEGENISMQTGAGYFMIRRDGGSLTNAIAGA